MPQKGTGRRFADIFDSALFQLGISDFDPHAFDEEDDDEEEKLMKLLRAMMQERGIGTGRF